MFADIRSGRFDPDATRSVVLRNVLRPPSAEDAPCASASTHAEPDVEQPVCEDPPAEEDMPEVAKPQDECDDSDKSDGNVDAEAGQLVASTDSSSSVSTELSDEEELGLTLGPSCASEDDYI
eukprot:3177246-Amphidinium_carterae.1